VIVLPFPFLESPDLSLSSTEVRDMPYKNPAFIFLSGFSPEERGGCKALP